MPCVFAAIIVVIYFKLTQKISTITIPSLPSVSFSDLVKFSRFSLEKAPSQSLVGTISSMGGDVEYESRVATEAAKISSPVQVQQGESLTTGANGNLILTFDKGAEIDMSSDTAIGIVQTLPADLVFSQNVGIAEYKKLADLPVSIRSSHLLIENSGDLTVSIDKVKPVISVKVLSGSATVAYNDTNNDSRVMTVESGKTLTFNDSTRRGVIQ